MLAVTADQTTTVVHCYTLPIYRPYSYKTENHYNRKKIIFTLMNALTKYLLIYYEMLDFTPTRVLSPFCGGIVYLSDPKSYAGWSFYTPVRATQARQVEGQRSDKVAAQLLFLLLS